MAVPSHVRPQLRAILNHCGRRFSAVSSSYLPHIHLGPPQQYTLEQRLQSSMRVVKMAKTFVKILRETVIRVNPISAAYLKKRHGEQPDADIERMRDKVKALWGYYDRYVAFLATARTVERHWKQVAADMEAMRVSKAAAEVRLGGEEKDVLAPRAWELLMMI